MAPHDQGDRFLALRKRAETIVRQETRQTAPAASDELLHLLNELEIHQIELELQNEELRTAQRQLEQSRRQYRDLYEFAPVGYLSVDRAGVITAINLTGAALLGLERETVIQRPLVQFVAAGDRNTVAHYLRQVADTQTRHTVDLRMARPDGRTFWARLEGVPGIGSDDDRPPPCQITMSDIDAYKQAEANALALKLEREKVVFLQQFLGDVSHDIKTPLAVLRTSIYLLKRQTGEDARQKQIDILGAQTARLENVLDGLLAMLRLDQPTEFDFRLLDANALVIETADSHRALATQHGHTLHTALSTPAPRVWGDYIHLMGALANLVVNALSYTPQPGTVTLRTRPGSPGQTIIAVHDPGVGIQAEDLPRIFDRFFRSRAARDLQPGGTGLGLAIVRKVVEAHDGHVAIDSTPGQGTTVSLHLPAQPSE